MTLKLFQTTVMEYKRFSQQLPIAYTEAMSGDVSDSAYVAVHTRLMLLRKYTKKGQGSQYLADIANEAAKQFPEHHEYLSEFQQRFQHACDQSLNHCLTAVHIHIQRSNPLRAQIHNTAAAFHAKTGINLTAFTFQRTDNMMRIHKGRNLLWMILLFCLQVQFFPNIHITLPFFQASVTSLPQMCSGSNLKSSVLWAAARISPWMYSSSCVN